jgi:phosphoribosylanthranilate isomerase
MTKVKICGITQTADIRAANNHKPDYIGFVFAPSKRMVSPKEARQLRASLADAITPVGVFVNETPENIYTLIHTRTIDIIQLHGTEDEEFILHLKTLTNAPIIKAVSVQKAGDAQAWENSAADFLLLDHKGGGTGESFDWSLIGEVKKPFFLAGGLSPENVAAAIQAVKPFAVDVSTGVELSAREKCPEKIKAFINNIH